MVLFNYSTKELTAKVVYYGPGLCGKTTNLQWIHEKTPIKHKGKMLSLATEADRTLFFDFLPIDLGTIRGMKTRIQLYTVPGQVFYNATRRMVLKGADCVVFVADSQEPMLDANLDAVANLKENLEANEIDADEIPTVLQYNKRDLPNALPVEILNERLNPRGLPFFEAVAMKGQGVDETLKAATALVFKSLAAKYGGGESAAAKAAAASASAGAAARAAAAPQTLPSARAAAPPSPAPAVASAPAAVATPRPAAPPVMAAAPADDLLDSIELHVAPEAIEEAPVEIAVESTSEVEALTVEELSLDTPAPAYAPAPGKSTIVRTASEADDMRRRIGLSTDPELTLDAVDQDDEDIEEISFDGAPATAEPPAPAPAAAPARSPKAAPAPPPAPTRTPPSAARAAANATIPPTPRAAPTENTAPINRENTAPIHLTASVGAGESEVAVPVEVTVRQGTAEVQIRLKITLHLKVVP
jgi:signal recognition particle receptor subunit beta